jgi:[protein-PII] uridylyltransferase
VRREFFALLGAGNPEALEALDHLGALTRYVPEWEAVRCRPQHNVYHRFTVDVHAFQTAARLARLGGDGAEPMAAQVAGDVRDREALLLAGLLHDLGKGYPGDHSAVGEGLARRIAARMGLHETQVETVAWLVRHHLLLVDTATRRDTGDENLVVETAAQVGDAERVRMLYVLSVADGLATGPTAWTPWKSALVAELFDKMLHVLERGELTSRGATELWRLRTAELRAALERHPAGAVEAHLVGMPRAYFLAFPTSELIRHFALMAEPVPAGDVRTHVSPTGERGVAELILVAPDRPGLFSKVSGALALNGINIISAQIFTRPDGAALEVFRVTGSFEAEIEGGRWESVAADLRAALRGRLALEARLAEKRHAYGARPARGKREPPRVIVDNTASDFATVIEVHAPDRIGLLYAVTSTLAELDLDIHLAKVATYGEDVVDAFYVRDLEGQKVTEPARIEAVEKRLTVALAAM